MAGGRQRPLPMAGGTGLIEEGERGSSTRLNPTFSQQGRLRGVTGGFIPLAEAKAQRWPNPVFPQAVPQLWLW